MKRVFLLICIGSFGWFLTFSQEQLSVSGRVYNKKSQEPIPLVEVIAGPVSIGVISDENGFFELSGLSPGTYNLNFTHVTYKPYKQTVKLKPGDNIRIDVFLIPQVCKLKEVVVEDALGNSLVISPLPYVQTVLYKQHFESGNGNDLVESICSSQNINGIRKGGASLDPVVRGFKFSQLNVLLNEGQRIEGGCPNRMDPVTSRVEPEDIESVDIVKGPYSFRYGPSMGGLILLNTLKPLNDSVPLRIKASKSYESNWHGHKENLNVFGNVNQLFYDFSLGRKDFGNYQDGNGKQYKSAFSKYGVNTRVGYRISEKHKVGIRFSSLKGRDFHFAALPMDERKDDTRLLSFTYEGRNLNPILKSLTFNLYHSDVWHEMDNKSRPYSDTVVAVSIINAVNWGGRIEGGFRLLNGNLNAGIDFENILKNGERQKNMIKQAGLPVKHEQIWNDAEITNFGIFAQFTKKFLTGELIGAIRGDFNSAQSGGLTANKTPQNEIYRYETDSIKTQYFNFSISGGYTHHFNPEWSVSFALGHGVRSPDMTERFIVLLPIGFDRFDYLGNPKLKPETNMQADLTLKHKNDGIGLLQLNGFYSIVDNYITGKILTNAQQKPLSKGVIGVREFTNAGVARIRGIELGYASPSTYKLSVSLFASYTYGTIDKVETYKLDNDGNAEGDIIITNDALNEIPPFEATLNIRYGFLKNKLIPSAKIRSVAPQNHVSDAYYENATPGFVLASFNLSYHFHANFKIRAGVKNIFDKAYYEHLNRTIIETGENLYEPGRSFYIKLLFLL